MARIVKIEPIQCGFESCLFTCFEQTTLEDHVKTKHYPEAAANDLAFQRKRLAVNMQNYGMQGQTEEKYRG